jgi:hypothetical protein
VDISNLIVSKSLSGDADDYKNKQPHVELADRMRRRDPGSAPVVGDRVPYVIIQVRQRHAPDGPRPLTTSAQAAKGTPVFQKSEDPLYVLENNIPIDFMYYLEQQLSNPLLRLFEAIIPDPNSLLSGDHTRTVYKATPTSKVGLMKFAVKQMACLGCKTLLDVRCRPPAADAWSNAGPDPVPLPQLRGQAPRAVPGAPASGQPARAPLRRVVDAMPAVRLPPAPGQAGGGGRRPNAPGPFSARPRLMLRPPPPPPRSCQGSLHQDVLCSSGDCPIFYMRKKVQKDLKEAQEKLDRFAF